MPQVDIDCRLEYEVRSVSDFVFHLHAMRSGGQTILSEELRIRPEQDLRYFEDPNSGNRFVRLHCDQPGSLEVRYRARMELSSEARDASAPEVAIADLPGEVLHYLTPTRYCESDLLGRAATRLFGKISPGYFRVESINRWVRGNLEYLTGASDSTTTAAQVFLNRAGVCRDFAHLSIAFCRALNIPARFVSGYVEFKDPPPDFHAVFEAYLGGRWVMFDPTGMAPVDRLVRIGTGRDAKDVAFATIFGDVVGKSVEPHVREVSDTDSDRSQVCVPPELVGDLLQANQSSPARATGATDMQSSIEGATLSHLLATTSSDRQAPT